MLSDSALYIGHHQIAKTTFPLASSTLSFLIMLQVFPVCQSPYSYLGTSTFIAMTQAMLTSSSFWTYSKFMDSRKLFGRLVGDH